LNAVADTTLNLPSIPGGKKLIYTHKNLPRKSLEEIVAGDYSDPFYAGLKDVLVQNHGLWSKAAEEYVLEHAETI
jgi:hypothetical protein